MSPYRKMSLYMVMVHTLQFSFKDVELGLT